LVLGTRLGEVKAEVVPFSFNVNKGQYSNFDVTYRYDLTTSEGIRAYESAVQGRFKESDQQASLGLGVEKVVARRQRGQGQTESHRMGLSCFSERNHRVSESSMVAYMTLGDGE